MLSEGGRDTAAELRRVAYLGLALIVIGGVASAAGFGWTSRRARALTLDIERTRALDQMKSEFVALASHELRTPLTGIYGFSQLLSENDVSEEERRQWATHIRSEAERLTTIVEDLLNVSRIEAGTMDLRAERVAFAEVVESVLRSFEGHTGTHRFECTGDPAVVVRGDRDKLVEVLGNVVDNAVKYSPGGGTVRIACESGRGLLQVRVSDDGLGIPESELEHVFERFTRVANPSTENIRSTGPRALPRARAGRAHGRRRLRGERARRGQRLHVLRTAGPRSAGTGGRRVSEHPEPDDAIEAGALPTVLIVEDEPVIRELVRSVLSRDGRWHLISAGNGEEAVELAHAYRPRLVLLDVRMPRMNGIDACRAIRDDPASAGGTIVMLTAMGQDDDIARGYEAGADDYFLKPF